MIVISGRDAAKQTRSRLWVPVSDAREQRENHVTCSWCVCVLVCYFLRLLSFCTRFIMVNMIRTTIVMFIIFAIHNTIADSQNASTEDGCTFILDFLVSLLFSTALVLPSFYSNEATKSGKFCAPPTLHHRGSKITFLSAPDNYARLVKVPLIPPTTIDSDASQPCGKDGDGHYFIGAIIRDKNNYKTGAPCLGIEGSSGKTIGADRRLDSELPKPSELTYYPGRFETLLNLSDRWGTCFVSQDGGFSREMIFQHKLNPHNGLFLEIYVDEKTEKVGLKYIEVSIVQEN
ncbi:hypothetical protein OS493_024553 [Desmophyllum pertusum]|uniref:Uncharacterized protein n=1 Tax=Desmophyllum pertusum TaxID=174260 RepID=A0A9X0D8J2_9CNID|nr:hypothetical protein OS493_024553 [Desmophyllum pertusum]